MIRFSQYIVEAFDKPYRYHMRKDGDEYVARFDTDKGDPVDVYIEPYVNPEDEISWEVEFKRGGRQSVTGEGDAMRIFATVMDIMKKFIAKEKPQTIVFTAAKEEEDYGKNIRGSREKLYLRLAKKYVKGYKVDMRTSSVGSTFYLTRK